MIVRYVVCYCFRFLNEHVWAYMMVTTSVMCLCMILLCLYWIRSRLNRTCKRCPRLHARSSSSVDLPLERRGVDNITYTSWENLSDEINVFTRPVSIPSSTVSQSTSQERDVQPITTPVDVFQHDTLRRRTPEFEVPKNK